MARSNKEIPHGSQPVDYAFLMSLLLTQVQN
ncbi:hypothetical protein LINGRAHAP2_LOCUS7762 [Linum grandiflorum]